MDNSCGSRILIACPCYPQGISIYPESEQSISRIAARHGCEVQYFHSPIQAQESAYRHITENYRKIRQRALAMEVDALLCIEADIIVPENALERLDSVDAGVVYGLYAWRGQRLWSAYSSLEEREGVSLSADPSRARRAWGQVVAIEGVGLGCTLIRRPVLEAVDFRLPDDLAPGTCCDWMFALDCKRLGIDQRAHLGVVCGHILHDSATGTLWPDPVPESLWRIEE